MAQQFGKARGILRGADEQHVFDARQHERGQRVIDHGLVVHRHELLADSLRHGVQASAGTASEDDAFAMGHGGYVEGGKQATAVRQGVLQTLSCAIGLSLGAVTDAKLGKLGVLDSLRLYS